MDQHQFDFIAAYVHRRSGRVLHAELTGTIERRLLSIAASHELDGLDPLIAALRSGSRPTLLDDVQEAIINHESHFFRDRLPFEQLRDIVLPELIEQQSGNRHLKVWSAAASTGQEPYSIAMTLKEANGLLAGWTYSILATDISDSAIRKAESGVYSEADTRRGLPNELLERYFTQTEKGWMVASSLQTMIEFSVFNLLDDPSSLGRFDIVFCRNVLIYFDVDTRTKVLEHIRRVMTPEGKLFLGSAESILRDDAPFKPVPGAYGLCAVR